MSAASMCVYPTLRASATLLSETNKSMSLQLTPSRPLRAWTWGLAQTLPSRIRDALPLNVSLSQKSERNQS